MSRPFSQSKATDEKMVRDLSAEDRKTMQSASARRRQILLRFSQINFRKEPSLQDAMKEWSLNRIKGLLMKR